MSNVNHKWKEVELPEVLTPEFTKKFICVNGDCKCVKLVSRHKFNQYSRAMQFYNHMPECYGEILLNEQPID